MTLILSGTNGLSDVDGSAATPAIRGTDANTGIFFPAADTIAFSTNGTEDARFDSAGNFGLGVTPSAWISSSKAIQLNTRAALSGDTTFGTNLTDNLYIATGPVFKYLTTAAGTVYLQNAGTHQWYNTPSGTAGTNATVTQAMTLDASGNLLVGTTSTAYTNTFNVASGTGNGKFAVSAYNNDTTSPRGFFYQAANTNGDYAIYFGVSGTAKFYVNGNGNVYGTGAYNTISDASLKTNIRPLETGLAEVLRLQPRRFDWIDGSKSDVAGFIAQEVEQVIPDLIVDWRKGVESEEVYKAISVTDIIPTLVKAIQEQQALITALTARLDAANL